MKGKLWALVLAGLALAVSGVACQPREAKFEITSFEVVPRELGVGETVTVAAKVKNAGSAQGRYFLRLMVSGADQESKEVSLAAGGTETVEFQVSRDAPGTYEVKLNGRSGTFTVTPLTTAEILRQSAEAMQRASSFHFEMTHQGGGTPIALGLEMTEATGDIVSPGKLRASLSATLSGMLLKVQLITVGETSYLTHPLTGRWEPLPSEFKAVALFNPEQGIVAIMKEAQEPARLNDEVVFGVPSYYIKGVIDSSLLQPLAGPTVLEGIPIEARVHIGKQDLLIRQVKLEGRLTREEADGVVRILKLSRYNEPVTIELPR